MLPPLFNARSASPDPEGEVERVTWTSCLGTSLVDTLFVLTSHQRFFTRHRRLINIVEIIAAVNTVVVVEHVTP